MVRRPPDPRLLGFLEAYDRPISDLALALREIILEEAVLTVADTGAGISEEDQKHVFARFFRADKARTRDAGGSGLGLAICKSIIEAHGGSIDIASKVGAGTTFTVRVPRKIEDPTLMLPEKIEV